MADDTGTTKFEIVQFHGDDLLAVRRPDGVFVAPASICRSLGLSWSRQRKIIETHPILQKGMALQATPLGLGGQEVVVLRLELINGWLFMINPERVNPASRDKVLAYQAECFMVLFHYFHPRAAGTTDQASEVYKELRGLVDSARLCWGERFACGLWVHLGLPMPPGRWWPAQGELPL